MKITSTCFDHHGIFFQLKKVWRYGGGLAYCFITSLNFFKLGSSSARFCFADLKFFSSKSCTYTYIDEFSCFFYKVAKNLEYRSEHYDFENNKVSHKNIRKFRFSRYSISKHEIPCKTLYCMYCLSDLF